MRLLIKALIAIITALLSALAVAAIFCLCCASGCSEDKAKCGCKRCACAVCPGNPCPCAERAAIQDQVLGPFVTVNGSSGTVIRIGERDYVLTAYHVIQNLRKAEVEINSNAARIDAYDPVPLSVYDEKFTGTVVHTGNMCKLDLALIRAPGHEWAKRAYILADSSCAHVAEEVMLIGNPNSVPRVFERGFLQLLDDADCMGLTRVSSPSMWYGTSGGGMYVQRGGVWALAGVCSRGEGRCGGAVWYTPIERVRAFIQQYEDSL